MDSHDEDVRLVLLLVCIYRRRRRRALSAQRSTWIRSIFERRRDQGDYHQLLQEMRLGDTESHFRFLRMSKERFDMLLSKVTSQFVSFLLHNPPLLSYMKVGPALSRRHYFSDRRAEISPGERLAVTLRYLATGNSQVFSEYLCFLSDKKIRQCRMYLTNFCRCPSHLASGSGDLQFVP